MPQTFVYSAISQLTRFGKLDFWVFMATREPHLHHCAPHRFDPDKLMELERRGKNERVRRYEAHRLEGLR